MRRVVRLALLCVTVTLVGVVGAEPAPAQSTPRPPLQEAAVKLQAGDFEGAITVLEPLTESSPRNGQAWLMLGRARLGAGDPEGARAAYMTATELEDVGPNALYGVGMTHAVDSSLDLAFHWLARAKESGRVNMTQLGGDPNAGNLADDPRYSSLFPTDEEFSDPFREPYEIVHEWRGEAAGDQFGWIARNIGDVDADGVNDVTTSAPTHAGAGPAAGRIYVYSGESGALLWSADGEPNGQLGMGIEAAGDVDVDGIPDVIAGAPGVGKAMVYSGRDGSVIHTFVADDPANDGFGGTVSDLGDQDGDGHDDVLVGASGTGQGAGAAYVYSGADGSVLARMTGEKPGDLFGSASGGYERDGRALIVVGAPGAGPNGGGRTYVYRDLSGEPAFVIEADGTGAQLGGMFVSVVGDIDGDGEPDVYASDWANAASGPSTGRIYVHSGASGDRLLTLTGETAGDGFGIGVADAGDLDGDGRGDLVIGSWQQGSAAPSGGKVYVYSGATGELLHEWTGQVPGETFGFDTTGMGDVNGDGVIDLLITSAWSAVNGTQSGRMFILSGKPVLGGS